MAHEVRRAPVFRFGPVLLFRGEQGDRWRLSALFGVEGDAEPDDLEVEGVRLPVPPRHLTRWRSLNLWRFDFAAPRPPGGGPVGYGFPGREPWRFRLPPLGAPLTVAYAAETAAAAGAAFPWHDLLRAAVSGEAQLLILGGRQIEGRAVWRAARGLTGWNALDATRRETAPFTHALAEEVFAYLVDRYVAFWTQPDIAAVAASLPVIALGSVEELAPPPPVPSAGQVPRGVALSARRACALFQYGARMETPPETVWRDPGGSLSQAFRLGGDGILALDPTAPADTLAVHLRRLGSVGRRLVIGGLPAAEGPSGAEFGETPSVVLTPGPASRCHHPEHPAAEWISASCRPVAPPPRRFGWFGARRREPPPPEPGGGWARTGGPVSDPAWLLLTVGQDGADGAWRIADGRSVPLPVYRLR
jgi:hypothetical protein